MCDIIRTYVHIKDWNMSRIGRRRKCCNIRKNHTEVCFKPCGIRSEELNTVVLFEDEMEAVRLADFEELYQQEASEKMEISRTTFSRLVMEARKKIADAILHKKMLIVKKRQEGKYL